MNTDRVAVIARQAKSIATFQRLADERASEANARRAENAKLREALLECADVLAKLAQTARIEGKDEGEKYAIHGRDTARAALKEAK